MTYSPGDDSASAVTRFFAASRVCAASTKRGLPSPRNLRMQKGRANQTPSGQFYRGQWGDYRINLVSPKLFVTPLPVESGIQKTSRAPSIPFRFRSGQPKLQIR